MSIFYVNGAQTTSPVDWKMMLAEPEKHWQKGYSAWALAHCWESFAGFPSEVQQLLASDFPNIQAQKAIVEHNVPMPGIGKGSQNDIYIQATSDNGTVSIAIEGKVSETFDKTIHEWHTGGLNREKRLLGILDIIGLPRDIPSNIRYQLLHRMASPVIEAQKNYPAKHAVMLIHSFSQSDEHFGDFDAFLNLYGIHGAQVGELYYLTTVNNVKLYAGWARGDKRFIGDD